MNVTGSVEAMMAAETLSLWVEHSSVTDAAELYDELRASLAAEYGRWRSARRRGWRGQADAVAALAEILDLTVLLDSIVEALTYRRGLYLSRGRAWPLVC